MWAKFEVVFSFILVVETTHSRRANKVNIFPTSQEKRQANIEPKFSDFEDVEDSSAKRTDVKAEDMANIPRKFAPVTNLMIVNISESELQHVTLPSKIIKWKSLGSERKSKVTTKFDFDPVTDNVDIINVGSRHFSAFTWNPVEVVTDVPSTVKMTTPAATEVFTTTPAPTTVGATSTIPPTTSDGSHSKEEICDHYKKASIKFDINKMADVWQTAYYKLPEKVQCFRIHIKKVTKKDKKHYEETYGNFSGLVNWNECNLEIKPASPNGRRHFLQGTNEDEGVLDNIIIEGGGDEIQAKVHEESADQWLVIHDLLLMRDCDTGGVVAFTKVPAVAKMKDLEFAFKDFSEEFRYGKLACDETDQHINNSYDDDKYLKHNPYQSELAHSCSMD